MYSSYRSAAGGASILAGLGIFLLIIWIIAIATYVLMVISMWKIFKKAGKHGWESLIPIYNMITLVQVADKPVWYIIFFFFPIAPIVVYMPLVEKFGKQPVFGVLLLLVPVVGFPMLAFGKNTYGGAPVNSTVTESPAMTGTAAMPAAAEPATTAAPVTPVAPESAAPVAAEPVAPAAPEPVATVAPAAPEPPAVPEAPAAPGAPAAVSSEATPTVPVSPVPPAPVVPEPVVPEPVAPVASEQAAQPASPVPPVVPPAAPVPPENPVPPVQGM